MTSTVMATFDDRYYAQQAIEALKDNGFSGRDIGLVFNDPDNQYAAYVKNADDVSSGEGAGFGAIVGAVVGLGVMVIPGIGHVIAAGPLAVALGALAGAGIGAATGGITAALLDMGVSEEDANYYAESVRRGYAVVSVTTYTDTENAHAANILKRFNPVDMQRELEAWRESGWEQFDPAADPYRQDRVYRDDAADEFEDEEMAGRNYPR